MNIKLLIKVFGRDFYGSESLGIKLGVILQSVDHIAFSIVSANIEASNNVLVDRILPVSTCKCNRSSAITRGNLVVVLYLDFIVNENSRYGIKAGRSALCILRVIWISKVTDVHIIPVRNNEVNFSSSGR